MEYKALIKKFESKGASFIDLRILDQTSEVVSTENGNVNSMQDLSSRQFGVRIFYKGAWGFAYTNDVSKLEDSFSKAFKLAKISSAKKDVFKINNVPINKASVKQKGKSMLSVPIEDKINLFLNIQKKFNLDFIKNKNVGASFSRREQQYFNSFGSNVFESREYFNVLISITGLKNGKVKRSFERIGEVGGHGQFRKLKFDGIAKALEDKLKTEFIAGIPPAGKFPLVIDNVLTHVFFHEAVGHACEADSIIEKSSVLAGKLGEKIAPDFLNLYDTPKIKNEHGYYAYDDEGVKSKRTILIKNGILTNYLHSLETANKLNMKPTGNGRAESAFQVQIPRMSNTVLEKGDFKFDELFEGIKKGIYAKDSLGGVVEPTTGNFLFNSRSAFLIENGKVTKPLQGVSFGGNILNILPKIDKIGDDKKVSYGGWRCGKNGQMVPVGGAAPHIKISEAMVGGAK